MAPKVGGYVVDVPVTDNQHVIAGQLLARIDDRDYRISLDQAQGQVAAEQANVANIVAQIDSQQAQIAQARSQLDQAQAHTRQYLKLVRLPIPPSGRGKHEILPK